MKKNFFVKTIFGRGIPNFPKGESPIEVGDWNQRATIRQGNTRYGRKPTWGNFVFLNILDYWK